MHFRRKEIKPMGNKERQIPGTFQNLYPEVVEGDHQIFTW